ncbi:hypothetical protein U0070_008456 [Myodes glareolus]|uniref:Uncharacterized protein n=1 Tax=Myodes glareolus TaxID=447135 RepID=A0AAW0I5Z1_MYOGA
MSGEQLRSRGGLEFLRVLGGRGLWALLGFFLSRNLYSLEGPMGPRESQDNTANQYLSPPAQGHTFTLIISRMRGDLKIPTSSKKFST